MTSLSKIAEQILRLLGKYTDDSDIEDQELYVAINQAIATDIMNNYYQNLQFDARSVDDSFIYNFKNIPVEKDDDLNEYFAKLPSEILSLMRGKGIKSVVPSKDATRDNTLRNQHRYESYKPVVNGFNDLYRGLEAFSLEDEIGFYEENVNIRFVGMTDARRAVAVDVKVVAPFSEIDEDETINIPPDVQDRVVMKIVQQYAPIAGAPVDETSDNIDQA